MDRRCVRLAGCSTSSTASPSTGKLLIHESAAASARVVSMR
jgi:hypothetical protein